MTRSTSSRDSSARDDTPRDPLSQFVRIFLESKLSIMLILASLLLGVAALVATPREEDPQIVVPLADVLVRFPGRTAAEVEQLVASPLERILYQIDGVEYVYSMSRPDEAVITVRFYVGQDRERSLVKLFKKLQEHGDQIAPGVTGWVMKPIEIDDVPVVTLAVTARNGASAEPDLRRVGEELVERLAAVPAVSRAAVIGGQPRVVRVELDPERLRGYGLSPLDVRRAVGQANIREPAGRGTRDDREFAFETAHSLESAAAISHVVVGVVRDRPVFVRDVGTVVDGPDEARSYVRHGWGPAREYVERRHAVGSVVGDSPPAQNHADSSVAQPRDETSEAGADSQAAVVIAVSKQKGSNAVSVAEAVLDEAERLREEVLPDDVDLVVTRNFGQTANEKVNELVEALGVAILIVILLLTWSMGWREALVVAVAVPVVFGLTLAVNYLAGYTINRVTLFALILALGLLVDDPIVDVENIARHFEEQKRATRDIVLRAVAEIRPPLISATLAVIVSFLPLFYITGMMGPYMSPMALNVPISMAMSMLVAFTITPWLSYVALRRRFESPASSSSGGGSEPTSEGATENSRQAHEQTELPGPPPLYDIEAVRRSALYRLFQPLMAPLLASRTRAIGFLAVIAALTIAALALGAFRWVPLKMLPFDNKNELLLVVDLPEGTTLETTDAALRDFERVVAQTPEVTDFVSYAGLAGPIDFNGLVRHYYLRSAPHLAELRFNLAPKKARREQSHAIGLQLRAELREVAERHGASIQLVELPPGPPVLASLVAEVYGRADQSYDELLDAADRVAERLRREPAVVDVDTIRETPIDKWIFEVDQEKAALAGVSADEIAATLGLAVGGDNQLAAPSDRDRNPLRIVFQLSRAQRADPASLAQLAVRGNRQTLVPIGELGHWRNARVDQTIYHKNLRRVAYVYGETAGRPPAECIVDIQADQRIDGERVSGASAGVSGGRTYLSPGGGATWSVPPGIDVVFSGEGEWKITLDVFRDLGIAFAAALVMIYVILVAQTGSFTIPIVVMLAIPLTVLGVMPGFYGLNLWFAQNVGGFDDPVYFTATAMIGMIALAGIVTRDSIILVDFTELARQRGRPLLDAILESRVVRLRPILLTAGAALLSSLPITLDPIFSGLGWSLIFGLLASTVFTLFVIPVSYWLLQANSERSEPSIGDSANRVASP